MATCNISTLKSQACTSGFGCTDIPPNIAWAMALQQIANLAGNTFTIAQLKAQACTSGFNICTPEILLLSMASQQVCNLIG